MSDHRRKVKETLHWISARHGVKDEIRLHGRLLFKEDPEADKAVDFTASPNPDSLAVLKLLEPGTCFVISPGSLQADDRLRNLSHYVQDRISPAVRAE